MAIDEAPAPYKSNCHLNDEIALLLGIPAGFIFGRIRWSVENHKKTGEKSFFQNGVWWMAASVPEFKKIFSFLSVRTISRAIEVLREEKFIQTKLMQRGLLCALGEKCQKDTSKSGDVCQNGRPKAATYAKMAVLVCQNGRPDDGVSSIQAAALSLRVKEESTYNKESRGDARAKDDDNIPPFLNSNFDLDEFQTLFGETESETHLRIVPPPPEPALAPPCEEDPRLVFWAHWHQKRVPGSQISIPYLRSLAEKAADLINRSYDDVLRLVRFVKEDRSCGFPIKDAFFLNPEKMLQRNHDGIPFIQEAYNKFDDRHPRQKAPCL